MLPQLLSRTYCLEHQRPEDQPSPRGLVCEECYLQLTQLPLHDECRCYWESHPAAYTIEGDPCWVYSLTWPEFQIRSLHIGGEQGLAPRNRLAAQDERRIGNSILS